MRSFLYFLMVTFTLDAAAQADGEVPGAMSPMHPLQDWGDRCHGWMCESLTYLAPARKPAGPMLHLHFELTASDPLAQAFADQVIDLVALNLEGLAFVTPSPGRLTALAEVIEDTNVLGENPGNEIMQNHFHEGQWVLKGTARQEDEEVVELNILAQRSGPGPGLGPNALGLKEDTAITIRAAIDDWRPVGHYLAQAFLTEESSQGEDVFISQILFVSGRSDGSRRIGLIDQVGGGLSWVLPAGKKPAHARFLGSRFEIALLDGREDVKALYYHNLLTGRTFPLATLPDLVGNPALADQGRLIAFASVEEGNPAQTDLFVVDVKTTALTTISLPKSQERDPEFSPDFARLVFVSEDGAGSSLKIAQGQDVPELNWAKTQDLQLETLVISTSRLAQPAWSPDGRQLAFVELESESDICHLKIYNLETGEISLIASGQGFSHPAWGPTSDLIALVFSLPDQKRGQILRLNLTSGTARVLLTPFDVESMDWSPAWHNPFVE